MKDTIFIKRYPAKGEFPKEEGNYHVVIRSTGEKDIMGWFEHTSLQSRKWQVEYWEDTFDFWLEPVEIPSEEEIEKAKQLVIDLANWSEKYPRGGIYSIGQTFMDDELIALEDRAKELKSKLGLN